MRGIDTNILLRFYINDDANQFKKVQGLLNEASPLDPVFINQTVIVEWLWVLSSVYKVSKPDLIKELSFLLGAKEIVVENLDTVQMALNQYKKSKADFSDCLIGAVNKQQKCKTTFTFDKEASTLTAFTLL